MCAVGYNISVIWPVYNYGNLITVNCVGERNVVIHCSVVTTAAAVIYSRPRTYNTDSDVIHNVGCSCAFSKQVQFLEKQ